MRRYRLLRLRRVPLRLGAALRQGWIAMSIYVITIALIFGIMLAGIIVERIYRAFAARNPQLGPFREPDKCGSCSSGSGCSNVPDAADDVEHSAAQH